MGSVFWPARAVALPEALKSAPQAKKILAPKSPFQRNFKCYFTKMRCRKLRASRANAEFLSSRFGCMVGVGLVMLLFDLQLPATSSRKAVLFTRIAPICVERVHRTHTMLS